MNRNLKRVLSLALMLVVMAVNFVIPAMAAPASIPVSYTDLLTYGSLLQRQGELYFETTPGTATSGTGLDSTSNNDRSYAPLDVYKNNNAGVNIKATEWVRFEVNVPTAGYYSVDMNAAIGAQSGVHAYIRTDKTIIEKDFARTGTQYQYTDISDIGYVYLDEGTNYIYVDNKGGSYINFRSLTLTLDESADATMVTWLAPVESANEIGDLTVAFDDGYNQAEVSTVTFDMDIPVDGKYEVSVMGITEDSCVVNADFGDVVKSATVSRLTKIVTENNVEVEKTIYGYTTIGVFPLTEDAYTMTLDGFTNYSLAWVKVDYVSPYETGVESESFSHGDTVARGTDNLTITFNDNMMETAAATLTLVADGSEIPVAVDVDGADVIVSFLETLDYESEYLLEVTGLQGVNDDEALADRTYTFTTADDTADAGVDSVAVTDVYSSREDVTIEGIVKGSTDYGIKGRTVIVTSPEGDEVATVTSGDDGAFVAEFTIADGTLAGAYTYTVTAEYGASENAIVSYVSEEEELRILDLFLSATTPETVYGIFESYGEILLIPTYAEDCAGLRNDDLFLGHFQQKDFDAVRDVAPFYSKMLTLEGMNQATRGSDVDNYLTEEICDLLGIGSDKLDLIIKNDPNNSKKTTFAADVAADTNTNGPSTSEAAFVARIAALVDAWLLEENEITATSLDLTEATTSCFYAGEIAIPLNFADAQSKVKAIEVVVTTAQAGLLTNAAAVVEGATTSVAISGNTATFTIDFEYDADASYDEVGKISLQASLIATHDIDVDATVTYRLTAGDIYADMPIDITGGTVRATVNPTPSDNDYRPTGGGYVAPPKEPEVEEDDSNKSEYFFDDMADALWAQDMVHALVGKGVISQNSERAFRPMDNISREEVVKMLVTVVGSHNTEARSNLADVDGNHWASSYIATAQELGIVQGNADGTFGLGQQITRQDMAVMIYRTFKLLGIDLATGNTTFADAGEIASYAQDAVSALEQQGIINGMGDGTFAPSANATRAQAAKVIYVMMEVLGV